MKSIAEQVATRYIGAGRYFRGEYKKDGLAAIVLLGKKFPFYKNVVYKFYQPRKFQRYFLTDDQFGKFLEGTILDVGSREDTMKSVLKRNAVLVDKNNPNLLPFDWEKADLPFPANSFDTVVCLDTLEHINDLHRSFYDLLRVSKHYVIISLPNPWRKTFKRMLGGTWDKGDYGLPPEKPFDRHKWFFNTEDIEYFIFYNSVTSPYPYEIRELRYHIPVTVRKHRIMYPLARLILPERYIKNLFVNTFFFVIEKKNGK
ncbi:MAG: methyltransferase domain-containing protein [Candidatus Sungbacteria bacterium]|uniref:Methyltransferase domain-containing protein n=1 Tax=Candidatus Sungiibacteriota bacterium TaxID=2750080 RepID=A0A9D6LQZ7_9BACT|nr:methyltransferase domain-containing protein [Candidatus Sungbacteria bacterium]